MGADRQQLQTAARWQQFVSGQPECAERRSDGGGVQPVAHPAVEVYSQPAAVAPHRPSQPSPSRPRARTRPSEIIAAQIQTRGRHGAVWWSSRATGQRKHKQDDDDYFHLTIYLTVSSVVQLLESES